MTRMILTGLDRHGMAHGEVCNLNCHADRDWPDQTGHELEAAIKRKYDECSAGYPPGQMLLIDDEQSSVIKGVRSGSPAMVSRAVAITKATRWATGANLALGWYQVPWWYLSENKRSQEKIDYALNVAAPLLDALDFAAVPFYHTGGEDRDWRHFDLEIENGLLHLKRRARELKVCILVSTRYWTAGELTGQRVEPSLFRWRLSRIVQHEAVDWIYWWDPTHWYAKQEPGTNELADVIREDIQRTPDEPISTSLDRWNRECLDLIWSAVEFGTRSGDQHAPTSWVSS